MEAWAWILVYLVGFTLFQLLLFRYFSDGQAFDGVSVGSGETAGVQSLDRTRTTGEAPQRTEAEPDADDSVCCPHCGARNEDDTTYTYCRNCLTQLH
jgi:hypothetical protein